MIVSKLVEILSKLPQDKEVMIAFESNVRMNVEEVVHVVRKDVNVIVLTDGDEIDNMASWDI